MAKFVIHKRGFFYNDEAYNVVEGVNGSIVEAFSNLEDAKREKENQDIISMQNLKEMGVEDFFFYNNNYDRVYNQFKDYYNLEFCLNIEEMDYFCFPKEITKEQAIKFLEILNITFHDIVEYNDNEELNFDDFNIKEFELEEF